MVDRQHDLPITKQAKVLRISRVSVYYLPRPVPEADLAIVRRLDRLHLEFPFAGSRMLRGLLAADGCKIGRPDFTPVRYIAGSTRRPSWQWPARAVTDVQHPHDPGALVDRKDNPINVRLFAEKQVPQRRILRRRRASFRMLVEAQDRRLEFVEPHGRLRRAFCIDVPSV